MARYASVQPDVYDRMETGDVYALAEHVSRMRERDEEILIALAKNIMQAAAGGRVT